VQLIHARRWLFGDKTSSDCDVPSKVENESDPKQRGSMPPALRFSNGEALPLKVPGELRSGDILILPVETPDLSLLIPGLPDHGNNLDQFESAHLLSRDKVLLSLSEARLSLVRKSLDADTQAKWDDLFTPLREAEDSLADEGDSQPFCKREWRLILPHLIKMLAANLPDEIWQWAENANGKENGKWQIEVHPSGGIIARNPARVGFTPWPLESDEIGRQGNSGPANLSLTEHQAGVEKRLASVGARLGLSPAILSALCHAARYHDVGKADPRFQAWLCGCNVWETVGKELVAKSAYPASHIQRFQKLSETPLGFRHELLSTLIVGSSLFAANHPEKDLLLHLLASHHGYCRACAPVVLDTAPESFTFTIEGESCQYAGSSAPLANFADGVPERFWKLTRRFGWWGLAYLETLIRLADQRESANPGKSTL
jgi:CRISPR-associated endonuclease/helicase Cas3